MKKQNTSAVVEPHSNLQNRVDFSGKEIFVGIDVHKERWQVAIFYDGLILGNVSMDANADKLVLHLRKRYPRLSNQL